MANNNSRPIISVNGVLAAALLLAILFWGFRTVLLNDLGVSTHNAAGDDHAAVVPVAAEAPAAQPESPSVPMAAPQIAEVAEPQSEFAPDGYTVFDQGAYQQLAAAGVNWQADYQAPDFDAARGDGMAAPIQVADSSNETSEAEEGEEAEDGGEASEAMAGDAEAGAKLAKKKCGACHNFGEGDKHKTGPTLYGVYGGPAASVEGYTKYSTDLKEWGGEWTAENLDTFLTKPKAMFKKTRMGFAGLKKDDDRANVIAYLKSLSAE